jgi:DNA polymerase III alpha subunit (gram-positive type)
MHKPTIRTPEPEAYNGNTRMKERPLAFVDLEFSGLGAEHEILEIGLLLVRQPGFDIIREWEAKVRPTDIGNADPVALRMVGYTPEAWKGALPLQEALGQFDALVSGAVLIGFNVVGDFYQLKKSYHAVGMTPSYHWQVLDVQSMVFAAQYRSELTGFRMREVVPFYKLKDREWHHALADAAATYDVFRALMEQQHSDER